MRVTPDMQGAAFQRGLSARNALYLDDAPSNGRGPEQAAPGLEFEGLRYNRWPTFIDTRRILELAESSLTIHKLVWTAGLSLIPSGAAEIASLFGYSLERAALVSSLLSKQGRCDAFASRADFLISARGLKCCEIDFVETGLWHLHVFNSMYRHSDTVSEFVLRNKIRVQERDPMRTAVHQMLRRMNWREPSRECTLAVVVPDDISTEELEENEDLIAIASPHYQENLRKAGHDGEILLVRAGALKDCGDHASVYGKRIQFLMTQSSSMAEEVRLWAQSGLASLVERDCVDAINGPAISALGNKIVLGLLSEAADEGRLATGTAAVVRSVLPWTRRIRPSTVIHYGREHWLPELLISNKDNFVLKPGEGVDSDGVRIGRNTSASEWASGVAIALERGNWVAQEAIGGTPIWYPGAKGELLPHGANVGIVVCGDEYAGAFLRIVPLDSPDGMPVIGYSQGALTGGVIEVNE